MSSKSGQIAERIATFQQSGWDAHYLAYFACFNQGQYYEAHEVLEELWLADRRGPNGDYYKGLIQLAGAFVHLQKNRLAPGAALFHLARTNLQKYPADHEGVDLAQVLNFVAAWLAALECARLGVNPLGARPQPYLHPPAAAPVRT